MIAGPFSARLTVEFLPILMSGVALTIIVTLRIAGAVDRARPGLGA